MSPSSIDISLREMIRLYYKLLLDGIVVSLRQEGNYVFMYFNNQQNENWTEAQLYRNLSTNHKAIRFSEMTPKFIEAIKIEQAINANLSDEIKKYSTQLEHPNNST